MKLNREINSTLHDLLTELHKKQMDFGLQIHRDMQYVMSIRSGNSHSGEGVTPETKAKVEAILRKVT